MFDNGGGSQSLHGNRSGAGDRPGGLPPTGGSGSVPAQSKDCGPQFSSPRRLRDRDSQPAVVSTHVQCDAPLLLLTREKLLDVFTSNAVLTAWLMDSF